MKTTPRRALFTTALTMIPTLLFGQAFTFTAGDLTFTENFDAMLSNGTAYLPGWAGERVGGTGALGPLALTVGNGSGNAGGIYNVGATGDGERALGTLGSAGTFPAFGASFSNGTGATVTLLDISAFAEQWRSGSSSGVNESVVFEYSFDATSVSTGSWTGVSSLSLTEILTTSTAAAAVDGNTNRQAISGQVSVSWAAGTTMWLRWRDEDNSGSDGLYALDDLTFSVVNGAPPKNITWNPPGADWNTTDINWLDGVAAAAFAIGDNVTFNDAGLANGATVNVQAGGISAGNVTVNNTGGSYIFTGGAIGGSGMLTKMGAGTLILQTTYANAISVQAGVLITQGVNLLSDIAGLNVESGARVEVDAGGDTVGPVTLTGGHLKANGTVTLNSNVTVNAAATNSRIEGVLALGGSNRTITLVGDPVLDLDATVSGSVRLALMGAGRVNLTADNSATYTGNVQLNAGVTLNLALAGGIGPASFFVNGGTLTSPANAAPLVLPNFISLGGDWMLDSARDMEFQGNWGFFPLTGGGTKTLTVNNTTRISGTITGTGAGSAILVQGTGKLIINGVDHSFDRLTVDGIAGAELEWNAGQTAAVPVPPNVELLSGARLAGSGVIGGLTQFGGVIAPGNAADATGTFAIGTLSTFSGQFEFDLGGTAPGESDRLSATGTVTLTGDLFVSIAPGYFPLLNDVFTLILNDDADPVTGEFFAHANNSTFFVDGTEFRIKYDGGDGNDVTLTVLTAVPEPATGLLFFSGLALVAGRRRR